MRVPSGRARALRDDRERELRPVGVTSQWTAPIVFEMAYDEVAGPTHLHIRGDFGSDADSVTLLFSDPAGQFPPQVVPGVAVTSCN